MIRRAARLLVIDPTDRTVLLFRYEDRGRTWWATPGGGLEGEEGFEEAARREAAEELGLCSPVLLPLWDRTVEFSFRGANVQQLERYFLLLTPRSGICFGPELHQVHVEEGIIAQRWWACEEIEATSDVVFPDDLSHRLRDLLGL